MQTFHVKNKFAADDWGISPHVNDAILSLAEQGALHSVSLMANGKFLQRELDKLLLLQKTKPFKLAIHFNLTEGRPIADPSDVKSLVGRSGEFLGQRALWLKIAQKKLSKEELATEFKLQWEHLTSLGCEIEEVNSHHHIHQFYTVFRPIYEMLREHSRVTFRLMDDPSHLASYWNSKLLRKKMGEDLPAERIQRLLYIKSINSGLNMRKVKASNQLPILIHPSTQRSDASILQSTKTSKQRTYDYEFVKKLSSASVAQVYWDKKILRWEKFRYSNLASLNPFAFTVRQRMRLAAKLINRRLPGARILDLGCGSGILAQKVSFQSYHGLDFSTAALNAARMQKIPNTNFELVDLSKSIEPISVGNFDLTLMLGITDWLKPEDVARIFLGCRSEYILFSYTQEKEKNRPIASIYATYRTVYDRNKEKPIGYTSDFFDQLRQKMAYEVEESMSPIFSPGKLYLWKRK